MKKWVYAAALALLSATTSLGASLTYSDGICEYRLTYDPVKVDSVRLKASFDYVNDGTASIELPPALATEKDLAAIDVAAYHERCAAHRRKLEGLNLIDGPGLERLRKRDIGDLEESCRLVESSLAAAKGDVKPMRALAPACNRYADLLALPARELKLQWNDILADLCEASTDVTACTGQLQRDGEGPGSEARRRIAVVTKWSECAASRKPAAAGQPDSPADRERRRLKDVLAKRFKAKSVSCAR